jgi:hypothetical protein
MRAHLCSKEHPLEIRRTKAELLLQWHAENGRKNILFTDEKFSASRSSITTRKTRFMLKRPLRYILRVQGCHNPSYFMVWWEVYHQG